LDFCGVIAKPKKNQCDKEGRQGGEKREPGQTAFVGQAMPELLGRFHRN
jgi:hypothetical protein